MFKVGDAIASNSCPNLYGTLININRTNSSMGMVRTSEGKTLLADLEHWHKLNNDSENLSDCMHVVEVKGPLSYFYPLNVDITEDIAQTIVGLHIKNCNHVVIGKVKSINWETGEWFGEIVVDGSVREQMLEGYRKSMSFEKEKENG